MAHRFINLAPLSVVLVLGITVGQARPPAQRAEKSLGGRRSISGRILADGAPAGQVQVMLTPARGISTSVAAAVSGLNVTETDDSGVFKIDDLAPAAYTVVATLPGYVVESGLSDENGQPAHFWPGDSISIRMIKGGVITGKVTSQSGSPVVGIRVAAARLRDMEGRPVPFDVIDMWGRARQWKTDDRGIYRIFGLQPGVYVVSAGGSGFFSFGSTTRGAYDDDSPTFSPSGTRDSATEITLHSGEELGGVDIRFREAKSHAVSGVITGSIPVGSLVGGAAVVVTNAESGMPQAMGYAIGTETPRNFALYGIPDGRYEIVAIGGIGGEDMTASPLRKITVSGADVAGLELHLGPFTKIAGHVVLERLPEMERKTGCPASGPARPVQEALLFTHRDEGAKAAAKAPDEPAGLAMAFLSIGDSFTADSKGNFVARLMSGGRYRIQGRLPSDDWYLRSVTLPPLAAGKPPVDAADGFRVKQGERLDSLTVTVAEGAAGLAGRVIAAESKNRLPAKLRVVIVPAEKESADKILRYAQTRVGGDGSFSVKNIAPGRYFLVVRPVSDGEWSQANPRPAWWQPESRAVLRREAETANIVVELPPCKRIRDYVLGYR
jgi:hypothetical protein